MPPTLPPPSHTSSNSSSSISKKSKMPTYKKYDTLLLKRKSHFLMNHGLGGSKTNFQSCIPCPPFDPKIIKYPFDSQRFIEYKTTSLEENQKHLILTEPDMGIKIDFIDPRTYTNYDVFNENAASASWREGQEEKAMEKRKYHPTDEYLLKDDKEETTEKTKKNATSGSSEFWLRKTEYYSSVDEALLAAKLKPTTTHKGSTSIDDLGASLIEKETHAASLLNQLQTNIEKQQEEIEKTFEDAKQLDSMKLKHIDPSKKHLHPVKVIPIVPDFKLWVNSYMTASFDSDPVPIHRYPPHPISNKPFDQCNPTEQEEIINNMKKGNNPIYKSELLGFGTKSGANVSSMLQNSLKKPSIVDYMLPRANVNPANEIVEYEHVREYLLRSHNDRTNFDDSYLFELDGNENVFKYAKIRNNLELSKKKELDVNEVPAAAMEKEMRKKQQKVFVMKKSQMTTEEVEMAKGNSIDLFKSYYAEQ